MSTTFLKLVLFAQIAGVLHAGAILRFSTTIHTGAEASTTASRLAIDGDGIKLDSQLRTAMVPPRNSMIFLREGRVLYAVDHGRKTYFKIDERAIGGMADTMDRMMAQMQERMKNAPPQQRAAMQKALQSRMAAMGGPSRERPKPELIAHDARKEINGYSCEMYDVVREGVKERELCITEWDNIAGGPEARAAMQDMAKFLEAMTNAMRRTAPAATGGNPLLDLEQLPGFPVSATQFINGKITSEQVLKSAKEQSFDAKTFSPPAGYAARRMGPSTTPR
jgi:hypothetical protein